MLSMNELHYTNIRAYAAVICDCDDTLIATAQTRWAALIGTAEAFGVSVSEDAIRRAWGMPFDHLIRELVPTLDLNEFTLRYREAMRGFAPRALPGAYQLLHNLKERNAPVHILTSSSRELILQDLQALHMDHLITMIWGQAQTAPFSKPDPRVIQNVLQVLRTHIRDFSEIVYIGDSVRDLLVARGNHLDFIAVTTGLEDASVFAHEGLPLERIVPSLNALIQ